MNIRTSEDVTGFAPFESLWVAVDDDTFDGADDASHPIGRGPTEAAAVADLKEQIAVAEADLVFTTFENIAQLPGEPPFAVIVEIGEKGDLTRASASAAATAMMNARQAYPNATLSLCLDGFDADPREIWDIPEARTYVGDVIATVFESFGPDIVNRLNLDQPGYALVGVCLGALRVTGRDPETGNYLLEPIPQ